MIPKYLVAAGLLICAASSVSGQSVKAGIQAWQRSDYAAAVAIWKPLAEKGDADAQFNLGQAYRLGRGVPTNLASAKGWFERSAAQGHVDAQTTLGLLLLQNGDAAEALRWLKQAAEKGDPRALLVYGTALVNGDGVTQDPVRGYAYVSRSAAQGLEPAKHTLADLDKLMPLEDRKKALDLARAEAKAAPPPSSAPEKPATKPTRTAKAEPAPKPVGTKPAVKPVETASTKASAKPVETAAGKHASTSVETASAETPPKPVETTSAEPQKAKPASVAKASKPVDPKGAWRIQLGAFSQRGSAAALYSKVSGKSALAGRHAYYIPVGSITRLQVGPFESKASASSACKAVGVPCFPVVAK
jgi:cell division septation protein DedD